MYRGLFHVQFQYPQYHLFSINPTLNTYKLGLLVFCEHLNFAAG